MRGLWEPVGGVFMSAPAVSDEGLPYVRWAIVLLVAAAVCVTLALRIAKKFSEPGWHLRHHMTEFGGAATLIYLVGIAALTGDRIGTLGDMPLNEVGDFLAGAFGPVAFLWLVLGFLQQGDELRMSTQALEDQAQELKNSVEHQSTLATAALEQMNVQQVMLQMQIDEQEKSFKAVFSIQSGYPSFSNGTTRNTMVILNRGADAAHIDIAFDPAIPGVNPHITEIRSGEQETHSFSFNSQESPRSGLATVNYLDTNGMPRHQIFAYELDMETEAYEFKRYYGGDI